MRTTKTDGRYVSFSVTEEVYQRLDKMITDLKQRGLGMRKIDLYRIAIEQMLENGLDVHVKHEGGY